jgi:hypothetical protein
VGVYDGLLVTVTVGLEVLVNEDDSVIDGVGVVLREIDTEPVGVGVTVVELV